MFGEFSVKWSSNIVVVLVNCGLLWVGVIWYGIVYCSLVSFVLAWCHFLVVVYEMV